MGCNSSKQEGYDSQEQAAKSNPDDPKKSAMLKAEALKVAEEMMELSRGKRFHEFYTRLTLTSYGASCKVLTAYHRTTNKKVAVKTIPKSRKQLDRQRQKVMMEIGTFRMVEDHPNAVRVLEIFEGAECYYIVMECCEGGELFDHISKKQGCFTERQAAGLLRSLMLFIAHMHSKGIAHLDIKPENLMFDSEGASGVLKVLDFGSSVFVQPSETVRNAFGTVRYASPEMANDVCGQKADIWSAGVVMYILLCGRAPFLKSNDIDTLNYIKNGPRVKFNGERWSAISQSAKDCIKALLEPNPRQRPTAVEVLAMPWLKQQVPETVIVPDTLKHLRTFANQSRIRRLLLGLMADQLVGSGANQLLGQFYSLDKDFSGTLEVSELVKAAKEAIPELTEVEINRMFDALDVDRTGTVDVKEFFAGLIQTIDEEKQTLVAQKSFTMLDKRGSGYVTKEAFMEVLLERAQAGTLKTVGGGARASPTGGATTTTAAAARVAGGKMEPECRLSGRQSGPDGADAQVILDPMLVSELEAEFRDLDANGDGVLSFEEFKAILGITSTPEGLTLAQPQLAAVPSLQEGMETLAQTLRTRTCSVSKKDEQQQQQQGQQGQGQAQRLTLGRVSHNGGGGGGSSTTSTGQRLTSHVSLGGAGGSATQPLSVDRAQLDLELPYDLETRDLLQLLAPAKRTASHVTKPQPRQSTAAGAPQRSSTALAAIGSGPSPLAEGDGGIAAAAPAPMMQSVSSIRLQRSPSSNASVPTFTLLDHVPSMRAPSLPPLPSRGNFELDANGARISNGGATVRAGGGSPQRRLGAGAGEGGEGRESPSQVRGRDPVGGAAPRGAEAVSPPGGVAEATVTAVVAAALGQPSSPRSSAAPRLQPPTLQAAAGGGGGGATVAADDMPLLGGYSRSSGSASAVEAGGSGRRRSLSASG